jgi:hypothetical protein
MLHQFDDYPVHNGPEPLLHLRSDSAGAYDRYFYNGFDALGRIFIGVALGVYPNRQVMDASFSILIDGKQHNVRASRHAGRDRTMTKVGPIELTVIRPMLEHRLVIDGRLGLAADLTWRANSAVIQEAPFKHVVDGRTTFDYTRITQFGEWSGWVEIEGRRVDLADYGRIDSSRDRSWGFRNGVRGLPGPAHDHQFHWFWAPTVFDDRYVHLASNDDGQGRPWHRSGAITARFPAAHGDLDLVLDEERVVRATKAEVTVAWQRGTRWPTSAVVSIDTWGGESLEVTYEPLLRFQMCGIGYTHREWGHGTWKGEAVETYDVLDQATIDPLDSQMLHVQMTCRAVCGDRTGVAVLETLAMGRHDPSGFGESNGAD